MSNSIQWHIPPLFNNSTEASVEVWENKRRKELLHLFETEVYGVTPKRLPDKLEARVIEENMSDRGGKNHFKRIMLDLFFENRKYTLEIHQWIPLGDGPFPVMLMIDPFEYALYKNLTFYEKYQYFPSDIITDQGYAAVKVLTSTLCMDSLTEYKHGILSFLDGKEEGIPEENRWGAIGVWAWACSRCIDYLETQPEMDSQKIAVSGMSRAGKTALWCGAQDQRIAIVMSNVSGAGGSAIMRGKTGEHIRDITTSFPFWFCQKYADYSDREDSLPVDAHMLIALAAPRPIYMASASYDIWADVNAEYKGLLLGSEVYQLYYSDLKLPESIPEPDKPFHIGPVGYHLRYGEHGLTYYDWLNYLSFCNTYFK